METKIREMESAAGSLLLSKKSIQVLYSALRWRKRMNARCMYTGSVDMRCCLTWK